jgi:CCR4-NOT transcription complex subunit 7/8
MQQWRARNENSFRKIHKKGNLGILQKCRFAGPTSPSFIDMLTTFFPCIYDVKYMMTAVEGMHGGLSSLADTLQINRIGPMHQAGSDSLLTAQTYFALLKKHFNSVCDDSKFKGELFGLGANHTKYKSKYNQNNNNNNNNSNSGQPQIQYSTNVHYSTSSVHNHQTMAPGNFTYEEAYC